MVNQEPPFLIDQLVDLTVDAQADTVSITLAGSGKEVRLTVPASLLATALPLLQRATDGIDVPDATTKISGNIIGVSVRNASGGSVEVEFYFDGGTEFLVQMPLQGAHGVLNALRSALESPPGKLN